MTEFKGAQRSVKERSDEAVRQIMDYNAEELADLGKRETGITSEEQRAMSMREQDKARSRQMRTMMMQPILYGSLNANTFGYIFGMLAASLLHSAGSSMSISESQAAASGDRKQKALEFKQTVDEWDTRLAQGKRPIAALPAGPWQDLIVERGHAVLDGKMERAGFRAPLDPQTVGNSLLAVYTDAYDKWREARSPEELTQIKADFSRARNDIVRIAAQDGISEAMIEHDLLPEQMLLLRCDATGGPAIDGTFLKRSTDPKQWVLFNDFKAFTHYIDDSEFGLDMAKETTKRALAFDEGAEQAKGRSKAKQGSFEATAGKSGQQSTKKGQHQGERSKQRGDYQPQRGGKSKSRQGARNGAQVQVIKGTGKSRERKLDPLDQAIRRAPKGSSTNPWYSGSGAQLNTNLEGFSRSAGDYMAPLLRNAGAIGRFGFDSKLQDAVDALAEHSDGIVNAQTGMDVGDADYMSFASRVIDGALGTEQDWADGSSYGFKFSEAGEPGTVSVKDFASMAEQFASSVTSSSDEVSFECENAESAHTLMQTWTVLSLARDELAPDAREDFTQAVGKSFADRFALHDAALEMGAAKEGSTEKFSTYAADVDETRMEQARTQVRRVMKKPVEREGEKESDGVGGFGVSFNAPAPAGPSPELC